MPDALDRWIEPAVPMAGDLRRSSADDLRYRRDAQRRDRRLPRVRPTDGGDSDHRGRQLLGAGRGADHRPAGEPAKRAPWARGDALQVGYRPLADPAHLQQGYRPLRGTAAGTGAPNGGLTQP